MSSSHVVENSNNINSTNIQHHQQVPGLLPPELNDHKGQISETPGFNFYTFYSCCNAPP